MWGAGTKRAGEAYAPGPPLKRPALDISPQDLADIKQWQEASPVGSNVPGTHIVPCKTPFEGPLADKAYAAGLIADEDWFGKDDLVKTSIDQGTPIGLVVDLVNTTKYYTGFDKSAGIEYKKVRIPGRSVPERSVMEEVFDMIDDFVARKPDKYVAVHCTHGINRTGFLVSAYLMTRAHLPKCGGAVAAFEKARGSKMDKQYLLEALMELEEGKY
uniref:Tyrosine specific protein phosphatases domain-containing protein n=1 Tax=Alexandrium catenella TaxID=2925 RepID=A0A7S1RG26_ALECA|mmetsp:Transcript_56012/g.149904  ORF Transcript_56012/g.149904 Transcript_56012/m.149904 type:complete len:215 (+) Transcript_56012:83-727(+)